MDQPYVFGLVATNGELYRKNISADINDLNVIIGIDSDLHRIIDIKWYYTDVDIYYRVWVRYRVERHHFKHINRDTQPNHSRCIKKYISGTRVGSIGDGGQKYISVTILRIDQTRSYAIDIGSDDPFLAELKSYQANQKI